MIEVLAQAADQATELTKYSEGINSIQGAPVALGCNWYDCWNERCRRNGS